MWAMPEATVRRDHHLDELDEAVAQRLDPIALGDARRKPAEQEAQHDGGEHLHVEQLVEGFSARRGRPRRVAHSGIPR